MKASSKTKYINEMKKIFNELLYMIIVVICYYIIRKVDGLGRKYRLKGFSDKNKELSRRYRVF